MKYDVIIIGSGPAGMTSALYASRAGLSTLLISAGLMGGQMNNTAGIENYPGFKNILGAKLGKNMSNSTMRFSARHTYGRVKSIQNNGKQDKIITTDITKYHAKTVIIATGAKQRHLGIPGENKYAGHGVSYCAVCDANFFKNKPVIVVGGGDSALTEAIYLSHIVARVTIMIRKDHAQAEQEIVDRINKIPNISIKYNTEVKEINGNGKLVNSVNLDVNHKPQTKPFKTNAIFIYIGMIPTTQMINKNSKILDKYHWIKSNALMETAIPGIFAVGDVRAGQIRQVATAIGDGATAGHEVYNYLNK